MLHEICDHLCIEKEFSMQLYSYIARDRSGKKITGNEEGSSEQDIISRLQSRDLIVVNVILLRKDITPGKREIKQKGSIKFSHKGIKPIDMANFARQLSTMIGAGESV